MENIIKEVCDRLDGIISCRNCGREIILVARDTQWTHALDEYGNRMYYCNNVNKKAGDELTTGKNAQP